MANGGPDGVARWGQIFILEFGVIDVLWEAKKVGPFKWECGLPNAEAKKTGT